MFIEVREGLEAFQRSGVDSSERVGEVRFILCLWNARENTGGLIPFVLTSSGELEPWPAAKVRRKKPDA